MNLKERGITVGDLLLVLLLVLSILFIKNKVKEKNKLSNFHVIPNKIIIAERY